MCSNISQNSRGDKEIILKRGQHVLLSLLWKWIGKKTTTYLVPQKEDFCTLTPSQEPIIFPSL